MKRHRRTKAEIQAERDALDANSYGHIKVTVGKETFRARAWKREGRLLELICVGSNPTQRKIVYLDIEEKVTIEEPIPQPQYVPQAQSWGYYRTGTGQPIYANDATVASYAPEMEPGAYGHGPAQAGHYVPPQTVMAPQLADRNGRLRVAQTPAGPMSETVDGNVVPAGFMP